MNVLSLYDSTYRTADDLKATRAGELQVGEDEVEGLALREREAIVAAGRMRDRPAFRREHALERGGDGAIIFNEEYLTCCAHAVAGGSTTPKMVPWFTRV